MDLNPVLFPQVTNRESFRQIIGLYDDDTNDPLDLTSLTFACEVRFQTNVISQPNYGVSYYDDTVYGNPVITLSLGSGLTVIDLGQLEVLITAAQMRGLCAGTYSIALTASDDTDTRQIFLGFLPVLFGGVS